MDDYKKIIYDLNIINSKVKSEGLKIVMTKRLIDRYKDNEYLIKGVLKIIKDTELYSLVLRACPELLNFKNESNYLKTTYICTGQENVI